MVSIHGAEYPLSKIFSNDFIFSIPDYQRPYAWTTEHTGELLEDLITCLEDKENIDVVTPYFLGSIVLVKEPHTADSKIVDGQQRLTTLTILLAVLRDLLPEFSTELTPYLYAKGGRITGKPNQYRLTLRNRDADFFQNHIQDEGGIHKLKTLNLAELTESQQNIRENTLLILQRLSELPESLWLELAQFVVNRCFMVVVSTPDHDSAYRIFSVLNDGGLNLSHIDILKAEIIGSIEEEEQTKYTEKWENAEERLGRDTFHALFSHIRMIYRKTYTSNTMLREIRQFVRPKDNPKQFIEEILLPYGRSLYMIQQSSYSYGDKEQDRKVNSLLKWLNKISNTDWQSPAILYLALYRNDSEALIRFFTDLERLAAGIMIRGTSVSGRVRRYGQLLGCIEQNENLYEPSSPLQLTTKECKEIFEILSGDFYQVSRARKYVLLRLDSILSGSEASYEERVISVEHVLPQNPSINSRWMRKFGNYENRAKYVHLLGNLVLLSKSKNLQANNYDFERKKEKYFTKRGVTSFALTTQVLRERDWTPEVIQRRQGELLEILAEFWRL